MTAPLNPRPPLQLVPNPDQVILLPQNMEAEAGVLGSILIDNASIVITSPILKAEDFFREAHRAIYTAMLDLFAHGVPSDFITLTDELARRGRLDDVGGIAYISELANQVPTTANVEHYARIVARTAILRRLIAAAGKIAAVAYTEPDSDVAIDQTQALITSALADTVTPASSRFAFMSDTEVENMAPPEWLIGDILVANTLSIIYGEYGSAKSFLALDYALCVATGTPWLGRAVKQGTVAYIAGEGIGGMGKRIKAWKSYHGWSGPSGLHILGDPPQLLADGDIRLLIVALHNLPQTPQLVIIDTLARSLVGGDENSAQDMGLAIQNAEAIRREFNCHVAIVHHSPWDAKRPRGSSSLPGAAYTTIAVAKEENAITVHCGKQKDYATFADISLMLHQVALDDYADETSCVLIVPDTAHSVIRPHRKQDLTNSERKVLTFLQTRHAAVADIVTDLNMARSTVNLALQGLIEQHLVFNDHGIYCLVVSNE